MTATAAVSRDATVSLRDLIAREPERTATGQRIAHLWQRTLHQPADDCRFAIADLVNTKRLERTGPSQWTTTTAHHRLVAAFEAIVKKNELVAPPVPFAEPEEDTGDPTDDDGAADDPKAADDDEFRAGIASLCLLGSPPHAIRDYLRVTAPEVFGVRVAAADYTGAENADPFLNLSDLTR